MNFIIDYIIKKFMKDVINMSWDGFNLHEWEKDKLDEMVVYNREQKALKDGIKQGIEQTIKEMLKNNLDLELISKITNKSIEVIREFRINKYINK